MPDGPRIVLVADLERLAAAWAPRLIDAAEASGPGLLQLRTAAIDLQARAAGLGFSNLVRALSRWNEMTEPGRRVDVRVLGSELVTLSAAIAQAKRDVVSASVTFDPRRAIVAPSPFTRPSIAPGPAPGIGPSSLSQSVSSDPASSFDASPPPPLSLPQPPMIQDDVRGSQPPDVPPLYRPEGPPPMIRSSLESSPEGRPSHAAPRFRPGLASSFPPPPMGARTVDAEGVAPLSERPPPPSRRAAQIFSQTLFQLRAFGQRASRAEAHAQAPSPPQGASSPILHLKGFSNTPNDSPALPSLLSNSLPPLTRNVGSSEPAPRMENRGAGAKDKGRRASMSPTPAGRRLPRNRRPSSSAAWLAGAGGVLFSCGLVIASVVGWRHFRGDGGTASASGSASPTVVASPVVPSATPALSIAKRPPPAPEELRAVLDQAHAGEESEEMSAFIDEQATLQAKLLETGTCEGSAAACAILYKTRQEMSSPKNVIKKKPENAHKPARASWLSEWKQPSIPVADKQVVRDYFLKFTETEVGINRFSSMLFRCGAYTELIQSRLAKFELPESLLAVVLAESGCEPTITSKVGAGGLWQFMPEAANAYHLMLIDGVLDERHSPTKATEAAIHYLADLYKKFHSWELAIAAYNMGPYGLMARLQRAGEGATFWDLYEADLLPEETSQYVPIIEAFALILANQRALKFSTAQTMAAEESVEFEATSGTRLGLIARAASTSKARIQELNLELKGDIVPKLPRDRFLMRVPKSAQWQINEKLEDLMRSDDLSDACVSRDFDWGRQKFKGCPKLRHN